MPSPTPASTHTYTYVLDQNGIEVNKHLGVSRDRRYGLPVYTGVHAHLPVHLNRYRALPHTWGAHVERELNGLPVTAVASTAPTLRTYQHEPVEGIVAAYAEELPGFVLAYPTGSGKTTMAIAAINRVAASLPVPTTATPVLPDRPLRVVVLTTHSHQGTWRKEITEHGTGVVEWIVLNHHDSRIDRLFDHAGSPLAQFDVVVTDEAQHFAHEDTKRSRAWRRLVRWTDASGPKAFVLNLSATIATTPSETVTSAPMLAVAAGVPMPDIDRPESDYDTWLRSTLGLGDYRGPGRWSHLDGEEEIHRLTGLLYSGRVGTTCSRTELGLLEQPRRYEFIELDAGERALYDACDWDAVCAHYSLPKKPPYDMDDDDPRKIYLEQMMSASRIKVKYVAELAVREVLAGRKVIIPVWYAETATGLVDKINEIDRDRGVLASVDPGALGHLATSLTGAKVKLADREGTIRAFQGGDPRVIVTSIVEAVSLHANQYAGGPRRRDGTYRDADGLERVTLFGDVLCGGKKAFQAEGRGTRENEVAEAVYLIAKDTREVPSMARMFGKLADTRSMSTKSSEQAHDYDLHSFTRMADALEA